MPRGVYSGLGAVGCSGLVEYVANVGVDGSDGDYELFGDLPVGLAIANQSENINLSLGKPPGYPEANVSPARDIKSSACWRRGGIPKSVEIWRDSSSSSCGRRWSPLPLRSNRTAA